MIITVLDTETTGLDRNKHEIIEISLISYVVSEDGDRYITNTIDSKLSPRHIETASKRALEINHYDEVAWSGAPDISEVLPSIAEAINKSNILIGQNLIFDLRRIMDSFEKNNIQKPSLPPYIDTKAMADELKKKGLLEKSGMDYLCQFYMIDFEGQAHSALADCKRTMQVFDKLLIECDDYDVYSYENPYDPHRRF